jgi:hypothetical protein
LRFRHGDTVKNVDGSKPLSEAYALSTAVPTIGCIWRAVYIRPGLITNGHSKKIDNHVQMVALYMTWYNFAQINSAVRMSPAMACGLEQRLWNVGDIVKLAKVWEGAHGYKRRIHMKQLSENLVFPILGFCVQQFLEAANILSRYPLGM